MSEHHSSASALDSPVEGSDAALMVRLRDGDDLALNVLMHRWRDRVASYLLQMTGQCEVAADLAQETFVRLYQARLRYRPDANFSTYLFAIAANLARNHARWKRRHPTVSLPRGTDARSLVAEPEDPGQSPSLAAETKERLRSVHEALQQLPLDLREAMTLFIHEDLGYAEIASVAGCSPKAAETRIYRARQLLKTRLSKILS